MSGSIGCGRITRAQVEPTVQNYIKTVLSGFPGYRGCIITGSYNGGTKPDHGDIDLVIYIEHTNIVRLRQEFRDYLTSLSDSITIPFLSGKHAGSKAQSYGGLVTCAFPIAGTTDPVQIDNILVTSQEDADFQVHFLNLSAPVQALLQGVARTLLTSKHGKDVLDILGVEHLQQLGDNEEYELVLSGKGLSLRLVELERDDDGVHELSHTELWRTNNWSTVEDIFRICIGDIYRSYDELLDSVAYSITDERPRKRIVGVMRSMINVGPGEVGTPKGLGKEQAIKNAEQVLLGTYI